MLELNRLPRRVKLPTFTQVLMIVAEYAWAILVILNGNSVFHAASYEKYHLLEYSVVMTYLLLGMELYIHRIRPPWKTLVLSVGLLVYCMVYVAARQSSMSVVNFVYLFVLGLPALFLLFSIRHSRGRLIPLFRRLCDVLVVLAPISLYYWLFAVNMRWIPPNCYIVIDWGYRRYVMGFDQLQYAVQIDSTFFPEAFIYRNSSLFTEAPMYNLWLDIALAGELFLRERTSRFRVVLLVITILSTMSVTGMLYLALCLLLHLVRKYPTMERSQKRATMLLGMVAIPALVVGLVVAMTMKSDTQSYSMRLSDYVAGFKLWLDEPIFGAGYANLQALLPYMYSPDGVLGFSNSLTAVLGTGGVWISLLFYIPQFGALSPKLTGDSRLSYFAICYLFLFCTTAFFGRYVVVVMAAFTMALIFDPSKLRL